MRKLSAIIVIVILILPLMSLIASANARGDEIPVEMVSAAPILPTAEGTAPTESKIYVRVWEVENVPRYNISDCERNQIERIVASEGGYCEYRFQALVAECILNSAEADKLRPTELFKRGDFWLTHNVEPTEITKRAVSDVFDRGILPTEEKVRWYYNPNFCNSDFHESMRYVLTCCDCRFFADWEE